VQPVSVFGVVIPFAAEGLIAVHQQVEPPAHLAVKGFHAVVPSGFDVIAELFAAQQEMFAAALANLDRSGCSEIAKLLPQPIFVGCLVLENLDRMGITNYFN